MRAGLLILSGYNIRAVVALCRWARAAAVPVHIVARNADDPIRLTAYAGQVFVTRASAALDPAETAGWISRLRDLHGYDAVIVMPTTEYFNRFVLAHRAAIERAGGIVPLVSAALYAQVSDKAPFAALCASHGISIPVEYDDLPDAPPFVAKPRGYGSASSGRIKPYLVRTAAERHAFLASERPDGFFFQELVDGESLYLLAHMARDGSVTSCAQENLMQQAEGGSMVLARAHALHLEPEAERYTGMLRTIGFHGLVMIEVRRSARTGRTVMIEANPRLWGPLQFTLDRGVDLFRPLLADHGVPVQAPSLPGIVRPFYFWSGGLTPSRGPVAFHNYSPDQK
jgi:predicted ATP-grasp superfamily ATP-dependent carboligase